MSNATLVGNRNGNPGCTAGKLWMELRGYVLIDLTTSLEFSDSLETFTRLTTKVFYSKGGRATGKRYTLEDIQRSQAKASNSLPFINHIRCTFLCRWEMQKKNMQSVSTQGSLLKSQDSKISMGESSCRHILLCNQPW